MIKCDRCEKVLIEPKPEFSVEIAGVKIIPSSFPDGGIHVENGETLCGECLDEFIEKEMNIKMTNNLGYDPKLKEAVSEIKAILKKHDIGGFISLTSKTHGEFRIEFPEWSLAQFTSEGEGVRIRCKRADYPDKESQRIALELTTNFLLSTRDCAAMAFGNLDQVVKMLENEIEIEHEPFKDFKKHEEQ